MFSGKNVKFHPRKRCIGFLLVYAIVILFIASYVISNLYPKIDNCNLQNADLFERERNLSNKIETSIQKFLFECSHNNNFQKIKRWTKISKDIYIYSAYFDYCSSTYILSSIFCVKFIGITLTNASSSLPNVKCAFKSHSSIFTSGFAVIERLPEDHSKVYTASYFYCPVENSNFSWPDYATLFNSSQLLWLPVQNNLKNVNSNFSISLCVRPFYGSFPAVSLIEFLSFYLTMGVDHFIFYHHKVSNSTEKFLNFLVQTNLSIELLSWDIPVDNEHIHEYGQIVFTQDCIARSKYKFTFTLIVDIDEFVVPKLHHDIKKMLLHLETQNKNAGSYVISMVLFCDEYTPVSNHVSLFRIFNHNRRQKTFWQYQFRSKYIVKPEKIHSGGIHFVWKHDNNSYEVLLPPSLVLLHHYRSCCGMQQTWFFHLFKFYVLNDKTVVDNSVVSYEQEILNTHFVQVILNSLSCNTTNS